MRIVCVFSIGRKELPDATIYIDGASKGNPGRAGAGIIFYEDKKIAQRLSIPLGFCTNNVAEYKALITALEYAKERGIKKLKIFTDSELLVKQMRKDYKVKAKHLISLYKKAKELEDDFEQFFIEYIPRKKNKEANALAQKACAQVAELADALDSGSSGSNP